MDQYNTPIIFIHTTLAPADAVADAVIVCTGFCAHCVALVASTVGGIRVSVTLCNNSVLKF